MTGVQTCALPISVVEAAFERHLLINRTSDTVVRLLPPYVITESEITAMVDGLGAALDEVVAQ